MTSKGHAKSMARSAFFLGSYVFIFSSGTVVFFIHFDLISASGVRIGLSPFLSSVAILFSKPPFFTGPHSPFMLSWRLVRNQSALWSRLSPGTALLSCWSVYYVNVTAGELQFLFRGSHPLGTPKPKLKWILFQLSLNVLVLQPSIPVQLWLLRFFSLSNIVCSLL